MSFDHHQRELQKLIDAFPQLRDGSLCYLDSAASALKPQVMIDAYSKFYSESYAPVHRGIYPSAQQATELYEACRLDVANWLGVCIADQESSPELPLPRVDSPGKGHATSSEERALGHVIFTRGTTESLNMLAIALSRLLRFSHESSLQDFAGRNEVLIPITEHHANLVSWQLAARESPLKLVPIAVDPLGCVDLEDLRSKLGSRTLAVTSAHISNITGHHHPIEEMSRMCQAEGSLFIVDGAQGAAMHPLCLDMKGIDAYAFSAHKLYGPTGVGGVYLSRRLAQLLPPVQGGGEMVEYVSWDRSTFVQPPLRFEAGTPSIAEVIAWGATLRWLKTLSVDQHYERLKELAKGFERVIQAHGGVILSGEVTSTIMSFNFDGLHPLDVAMLLGQEGVCVRSGHHCAMTAHRHFHVERSLRVSLGIYNSDRDLERFERALEKALGMLR